MHAPISERMKNGKIAHILQKETKKGIKHLFSIPFICLWHFKNRTTGSVLYHIA